MDLIVQKLAVITRSMSVLDTRLTVTEDRISSIISHSRGLHDPTSGAVAHAYTTPYVSISNQGSSHSPHTIQYNTIQYNTPLVPRIQII